MTNNNVPVLNIIDNRPNLELLNVLKDQIRRSEEVVGVSRGLINKEA
jgi:hypothetical protein